MEKSPDATTPPRVMMQVALPSVQATGINIEDLAGALGLPVAEIARLTPPMTAEAGMTHLFIQLDNLETVQNLSPDFVKLSAVSKAAGVHTVACFTMQTSDPARTLHIRDFCPAVGADEVPASGTTNGALAGYLLRHGLVPVGKQIILAEQGAELGRPSLIRCEISSDGGVLTSVRVGGQAVASLSGVVMAEAT